MISESFKKSLTADKMLVFCLLISFISAQNNIDDHYGVTHAPFQEPMVHDIVSGEPVKLSLDYFEYKGPYAYLKVRGFNSSIPGPTIRVYPGEDMSVSYLNNLTDQVGSHFAKNGYAAPDTTNIHFHGIHAAPQRPHDDVTVMLGPGQTFNYSIKVIDTHMPGTHWIHPHMHGSATLQVGGGAASALIIKDPKGYLPKDIEDAKEQVMVIQYNWIFNLTTAAKACGDVQYTAEPGNTGILKQSFVLVNGMHIPVVSMRPGEWQRWRLIHAGFTPYNLDMEIQGCEMQLLAKDGLYINDYPRRLLKAILLSGGRVDLMVRCEWPGEYIATAINEHQVIVKINVKGDFVPSGALLPWRPITPNYLRDLQHTDPSPGCDCMINMRDELLGPAINGRAWDISYYLHTTYIGAVVERHIAGQRAHPYHQHTYPFQIIKGFWATDFFKEGDWHDTFQETNLSYNHTVVVRYKPENFYGRVMLHCHQLSHEDNGMMAQEYVFGTGDECTCGPDENPDDYDHTLLQINGQILILNLISLVFGILML